MRNHLFLRIVLVIVVLLSLSVYAVAGDLHPGIQELYRLDRLPAFKKSIKMASVSSYDRTGGNNDGFGGQYSFVRKEEGGLVLADLEGPGTIYRIWTPTPTDDMMEFYFDGESEPSIKVRFREPFLGEHPVFVKPLVGYGAGGFYSYVPLPYEKSCKVFIRAERMRFYQINYATYPERTAIVSFPKQQPDEYETHLKKARQLFASSGKDTTIDGELVIHGTGSEDFYNGGWYDVPGRWDAGRSFPLSGCLAYKKHLGRTGGYRFLLGDAYMYRQSILQTIEHSPTGNELLNDYCAVTYLSSRNRPTCEFTLPPFAGRKVIDLERVD